MNKKNNPPKYEFSSGFAHIILLITIVLIGIAGVSYLAYKNGQIKILSQQNAELNSPTPTVTKIDTSAWKMYINKEYGFQSGYLSSAPPKERTNGPEGILFSVEFGVKPNNSNEYYLSVQKQKDINTIKNEFIGPITKKIDREDGKHFNGVSWHTLNYVYNSTSGEINNTTAITNRNDLTYSITTETKNIDQILSTFKFLQ